MGMAGQDKIAALCQSHGWSRANEHDMNLAALTIDARRLWAGEQTARQELAFVDLDATHEWPDAIALPPCPVVGLGSPDHPLAVALDAVVEPPVTAANLMGQVLACPKAAAISVQLLRLLPGLGIEPALAAESFAYGLLQGSHEHHAWLSSRPAVRPASSPGRVALDHTGAHLTIALDREAHGNAVDRAMRDALREAFAAAALDDSIEKLVLQANGRSFSLGADLSEFGTISDPASAHEIRMLTLPAPMIAACSSRLTARVQGACIGAGLEMATWAHRIVASSDAWFHLPELAMGLLPGAGGCVSLSRRIGRQRTALMLLSGKRIPARIALDWGLIDAIEGDFAADQG